PYAIADVANYSNPSAGTANVVASGAATNNCVFGLKRGEDHSNLTTPGANDVAADPQFVDITRTPLTWAVSAGATASASQEAQMAALLSFVQAAPTRTKTLLLPYLRAGVAPQNTAVRNAGHDGTTPGAVDGAFPVTASVALTSQPTTLAATAQYTDPT